MPFKINISDKDGKTWKVEVVEETISGKSLGDKIDGKDIKPELEEYELEITGGSDQAGFPLAKNVEGIGLKRVLLSHGWGMRDTREGVRRRKTVRGKILTETTAQVNVKVLKAGKKSLSEVFPDQNKPKEEKPLPEQKPAEQKEEVAAE